MACGVEEVRLLFNLSTDLLVFVSTKSVKGNAKTVLKLINQRRNGIQRHITFANIREKSSLIVCVKLNWGGGEKNTPSVIQEGKEAG
jgi:hypothetical protein